MRETQVWKSIFRHGYPDTQRNRALAVLSNVFLHLHPVRVRKSGIRLKYTWCMGGVTFFLFIVETITGLLLMFYYRPTIEYAYTDIIDLGEQVPLGIMREIHRWGAHLMIIVPDRASFDNVSTDPQNGGPWIMWPDTPYAHLMVPIDPYPN